MTVYLDGVRQDGDPDGSGFVRGAVANYDALPVASESPEEAWLVLASQGVWPLTLKRKGLWYSDGVSWDRKGVTPRHDQLPDVDAGEAEHLTPAQVADVEALDAAFLTNTWTNTTRPESPGEDLVGYNAEEERPELYVLADDKWYYLWQGPIGVMPPTSPAIFSDDFETGWFDDEEFSFLFLEDFENGGW